MKKLILSILLLSAEINAQNKFQSETDGASELRGLRNTSDAYFYHLTTLQLPNLNQVLVNM